MKKFTKIVLLAFIFLYVPLVAYASYKDEGNDGSSSKPYIIDSVEDLQELQKGVNDGTEEVILEEIPNILKDLDQNEFKKNIYNKLINIIIQTKNIKLKTIIMNFLQYFKHSILLYEIFRYFNLNIYIVSFFNI